MKKVLITGASSGIGRAIAMQLLKQGESVVGVARNFADSGMVGGRFTPVECDLAQLDVLPDILTRLAQDNSDLSALVLCAGTGRFGSLEEFSYAQVRALIDLNFTSTALVTRAFLPLLKRRRTGDIVFLGSEAALAGSKRGAVYSATKFALRGFAQSLRQECAGNGVRITLINPGMTKTGFFDELDFAPGDDAANHVLPDDIADVVLAVLAMRPGTVVDEVNLSPLKKVIQSRR
ncbi:MAG: SDR family oxidoreductase [Gammaproteobacteria bacterium]|nr:SDR family oxidoreductase [Gammaproteobacteria bacterium]